MILAIDIGNTNIVVGCCKDNKVSFVERISTNHTATELEYAVSIKTILELYNIDFSEIDGAIISDRKSTRLNSSHTDSSRMPSSA